MQVYKSDGSLDLDKTSFDGIAKLYAGRALQALVEKGGPGLTNTIHEAIITAIAKHERMVDARKAPAPTPTTNVK